MELSLSSRYIKLRLLHLAASCCTFGLIASKLSCKSWRKRPSRNSRTRFLKSLLIIDHSASIQLNSGMDGGMKISSMLSSSARAFTSNVTWALAVSRTMLTRVLFNSNLARNNGRNCSKALLLLEASSVKSGYPKCWLIAPMTVIPLTRFFVGILDEHFFGGLCSFASQPEVEKRFVEVH